MYGLDPRIHEVGSGPIRDPGLDQMDQIRVWNTGPEIQLNGAGFRNSGPMFLTDFGYVSTFCYSLRPCTPENGDFVYLESR